MSSKDSRQHKNKILLGKEETMTKIIHFKIPTTDGSTSSLTISPTLAKDFMTVIKEIFAKRTGEDWIVLVTPFEDIKILEVE